MREARKRADEQNTIKNVLIIIFLICVFLLSIIKIEDTDTWTHLSLGKLIFNLKGLPAKEPFNYPSLDKTFLNPEWLFDVIFYASYRVLDIFGVILLKALIITAVFAVLLKDSLIPHRNHIVSLAVLFLIVYMMRHRFVERPDIVLMLFLGFTIFALNAFVLENKKYIYVLPFVHLVWANMHPSIVLMIVPYGAFLAGGVLQRFLNRKFPRFIADVPSIQQLKIILLVFLCSFVGSLINPYFLHQFIFPFELAYADWWQDEIMELQPPDWEHFKSPYLMLAALVVSFLINIKRISIIHLFLVIPFAYLSLSALRYIFLLGLVGGPIMVRNIGTLPFYLKSQKLTEYIAIFFLVLFTYFFLLGTGPYVLPDKVFGLGINYNYFPEKALRYLDKNNIKGRIFNTFQWGGYITWRDFPERTAFVDGRGVLSRDLLEKLDLARIRAGVLDNLHKKYDFEIALLNYPNTPEFYSTASSPDIDAALSSKDWALVYWDDLSLVYLKRNGRFNAVIKKDEYRFVKPANGPYVVKVHDKQFMSGLMEELNRNIRETGSSTAYAFTGFVLNEMMRYQQAIEALSHVRKTAFGDNLFNAYQGLAFAYGQLGYLNQSIDFYRKALKQKKESPILYNLGITYIKNGKEEKAAKYFEEALEINRGMLSIYPKLISIYQKHGEQEKLNRIKRMYESAKIFTTGEEHFQKGIKAYLEGSFEEAVEEYKRSIEANPSNPSAHSNLGYIFFDVGGLEKAYEYQRNAIYLDPEFANAHYGLALIYKTWGDRKNAQRHWEEYLRIEPKGYYSRKAEDHLEQLSSFPN
jgi:tetratricopeptide (TPR) repeat protein